MKDRRHPEEGSIGPTNLKGYIITRPTLPCFLSSSFSRITSSGLQPTVRLAISGNSPSARHSCVNLHGVRYYVQTAIITQNTPLPLLVVPFGLHGWRTCNNFPHRVLGPTCVIRVINHVRRQYNIKMSSGASYRGFSQSKDQTSIGDVFSLILRKVKAISTMSRAFELVARSGW